MSKKKNKQKNVNDPLADMLMRFKPLLSADDFSRLLDEITKSFIPLPALESA